MNRQESITVRSLYREMETIANQYNWTIKIEQAAPNVRRPGETRMDINFFQGTGWVHEVLYLRIPPSSSLYSTLIFVHEVGHALHCVGDHPLQGTGLFQDVLYLSPGLEDEKGNKLSDNDKKTQALRLAWELQGELAATSYTCYQVIQRNLWEAILRDSKIFKQFHEPFHTIIHCNKSLQGDDTSVSNNEATLLSNLMFKQVLSHMSPEKEKRFHNTMLQQIGGFESGTSSQKPPEPNN